MDTSDGDPMYPRSYREMAGASDWERLVTLLTQANPPHVIVAGPAGIGKSCALHLGLGPAISLWLRCSMDPTLRDSRDRIKAIARRRTGAPTEVQWIVLEHADMLHADAQAFLRRVIETSIGACRFILEVRDTAAITEPLLSRTVLFVAPQLVAHEIRAEVRRRAPAISLDLATRITAQSNGNVRWAVLQGLGEWCESTRYPDRISCSDLGGRPEGLVDESVSPPADVKTWASLMEAMETLQRTGSSPRAWLQTHGLDAAWDRPGGACPWALTALAMAPKLAVVGKT